VAKAHTFGSAQVPGIEATKRSSYRLKVPAWSATISPSRIDIRGVTGTNPSRQILSQLLVGIVKMAKTELVWYWVALNPTYSR